MSQTQQSQGLLFRRCLSRLATPLHPLLSVANGLQHQTFPPTLLHYHILTAQNLDELAHYYHQRTPTALSYSYPYPVVDRWWTGAGSMEGIEAKRRRFGRFMGLQGCESPVSPKTSGEEKAGDRIATTLDAKIQEMIRGEGNNEVERWMEGEMKTKKQRDEDRETHLEKGYW